MATETHIHAGGGTWRELDEFHVHAGGGTWRDLDTAYVHAGGGTWRKIFEAVSCACTGASIDSQDQQYDPTGCTCQQTPKVEEFGYRCLRWNYTGDTACQEMQVQYSTGGSYVTEQTVELNQSSGHAGGICSGATYEGYAATDNAACTDDDRTYRLRLVLKGSGIVCVTGTAFSSVTCIT